MTSDYTTALYKLMQAELAERDQRIADLVRAIADLQRATAPKPSLARRAKGALKAAWDGMPA